MLRQVLLLTRITACNIFGLNEYRYTKDRKKRRRWRAMAALWFFLFLMMEAYVLGLCAGLSTLGAVELIPEYLFTVASLAILFFTFFKAGAALFQEKSLQTLSALPVSQASIVCSRFLSLYLGNLALSIWIVLPGIVWYGMAAQRSTVYFLTGVFCLLFLPLFPMTLASAAGAGITAVSARMKHKSIVAAGLSIALVVAILLLSSLAGNTQQLTQAVLRDWAEVTASSIRRIYPLTATFSRAVLCGDPVALLLLILLSLAPFLLTIFVVQHWYLAICTALFATSAKGNHTLRQMHSRTPLHALWSRELRRYFASSIYLSNTLTGYVLMAAASVALLAAGPARIDSMLGMPGAAARLSPYLLGFIASMMPTTACSISMEGRPFWIIKSLPISARNFFAGKILLNLSVAAIPYLISVVFAAVALKSSFLELAALILIPAAYILFSSVSGLAINLAFPMLTWDSDVQAVKQGASTAFAMLAAFISGIIPIGILMVFPRISSWLVFVPMFILLLTLSALTFRHISRKSLIHIGADANH